MAEESQHSKRISEKLFGLHDGRRRETADRSCGGCGKSRGVVAEATLYFWCFLCSHAPLLQPNAAGPGDGAARASLSPPSSFIHRCRPRRVIWLLYSNHSPDPDPLVTVCQQFLNCPQFLRWADKLQKRHIMSSTHLKLQNTNLVLKDKRRPCPDTRRGPRGRGLQALVQQAL